ncbi:MAG TPA: hypothetical protein VGP31_14125, partial [Planosporangium sp.]|nr:hypothetical protein [Planosporangium sp.]
MGEVVVEAGPAEHRAGLRGWLLDDLNEGNSAVEGPHARPGTVQQRPWWQVMCLTGLDYFST